MNPKVCVICHNKKTINSTNNRLVVENCGHVKCMECLVLEKAGCQACANQENQEPSIEVKQESRCSTEDATSITKSPVSEATQDIINAPDILLELDKKKKLETSHIRVESTGNICKYFCTVCKKKFRARSHVAYHAYCNGQSKPYQCPDCDKSFATLSHYNYHMSVHSNDRSHTCDICGASFIQKSKLQRHKLKHTKEKKFECSICSKGFNNLTSLRKHGLTHTEEKPYLCSICSRRFRDGSNYRKHVAKHSASDKKGSCGVCGLEVSSTRALMAHLRAHQRRRFQCPRCPQAFHSNKDMRRHAAVHSDAKPFRCKVCDRRFRRKDNLERHVRNTHPAHAPARDHCDAADVTTEPQPDSIYEKTRLEIMNPLPPLPKDVIEKHMHEETKDDTIDKSYILEANNARQSVIVDNKPERKSSPPEFVPYVHKIRKANSMVSQKNFSLPPIDERKIIELHKKEKDGLFAGAPPKDMELYKKILYGRDVEDEMKPPDNPGVHWRRKMKDLNTYW